MYTTRDYGITFLCHDRCATANTGLHTVQSTRHASVEWVMGRYFTPDTVLRDRRYVDKHSEVGHEIVSNTLKTIITVEKQGS